MDRRSNNQFLLRSVSVVMTGTLRLNVLRMCWHNQLRERQCGKHAKTDRHNQEPCNKHPMRWSYSVEHQCRIGTRRSLHSTIGSILLTITTHSGKRSKPIPRLEISTVSLVWLTDSNIRIPCLQSHFVYFLSPIPSKRVILIRLRFCDFNTGKSEIIRFRTGSLCK